MELKQDGAEWMTPEERQKIKAEKEAEMNEKIRQELEAKKLEAVLPKQEAVLLNEETPLPTEEEKLDELIETLEPEEKPAKTYSDLELLKIAKKTNNMSDEEFEQAWREGIEKKIEQNSWDYQGGDKRQQILKGLKTNKIKRL